MYNFSSDQAYKKSDLKKMKMARNRRKRGINFNDEQNLIDMNFKLGINIGNGFGIQRTSYAGNS